eukprot:11660794-Alexandrium_andersonii.AAC.1
MDSSEKEGPLPNGLARARMQRGEGSQRMSSECLCVIDWAEAQSQQGPATEMVIIWHKSSGGSCAKTHGSGEV